MVTVDEINTGMGRFPNDGEAYFTYESYNSDVSITDNQLTATPDWTGAELIKRPNDWTWERCLITDHTTTTLTYTNALSNYTGVAGNGYFIQNDVRTLDQFGEWYHNDTTDVFYMYFGAENPNDYTVKVATLDNLLTTDAGDYITVRDISFEGSIDNAIENISQSDYFTVQNCDISFVGSQGIYINSQHGLVDNNVITNCNQTAIRGGSSLITVTNNTITNVGNIIGASEAYYHAIMTTVNDYGLIQYNTIDSTGAVGIRIDGYDALIKNNFVNNSCLVINDFAGIYTASRGGIVIDENIVLNSLGYKDGTTETKSLVEGIYLDFTDSIVVTNNICAYNGFSGIKIHKTPNSRIEGNILYENKVAQIYMLNSGAEYLYDDTIRYNYMVSDSGQYHLRIREGYSSVTDPTNIGIIDENYYSNQKNENSHSSP
jgi:parallel beta-helix repeat protein